MTMKLYVANVPIDATEEALRRHFATCGGVADVEVLTNPHSGKPRGLARVTMTSSSFAAAACARLDGAAFAGQVLRVSESPIREGAEPTAKVKILQQFRERSNMAYDLDCAGLPLTLRICPIENDQWRVDARSTEAVGAIVATGSARTKLEALAEAVRAWNAAATASAGRTLDGDALTKAMRDVKAV